MGWGRTRCGATRGSAEPRVWLACDAARTLGSFLELLALLEVGVHPRSERDHVDLHALLGQARLVLEEALMEVVLAGEELGRAGGVLVVEALEAIVKVRLGRTGSSLAVSWPACLVGGACRVAVRTWKSWRLAEATPSIREAAVLIIDRGAAKSRCGKAWPWAMCLRWRLKRGHYHLPATPDGA